jgi:hypothetical protein
MTPAGMRPRSLMPIPCSLAHARISALCPQFKAEAVQMVVSTGKTVAQVAKDLGIHDTTLGRASQRPAVTAPDGSRPQDVRSFAQPMPSPRVTANIPPSAPILRGLASIRRGRDRGHTAFSVAIFLGLNCARR